MAETPEGRVKRLIKAELKKIGAWFFMPIGGPYAVHGVPDIVGCIDGRLIGIECKAPGRKARATPAQLRTLKEIEKAGGIAVLADCWEDVAHKLNEEVTT